MSDNGSTEQFGEALRAALLAGRFPNPNHEGCPEDGLLKRIAARQGMLPVGDPKHVHIMQCSPCYQRLEGYRAANRQRRRIAAAAIVFLVLAGGYGAYRWGPSTQDQFAHNQPAIVQSELDLRPYTVDRSDQPASKTPHPLRLTASRVQLAILLPVGVEPGPFELRILDSDLKTRVNTAASAKLENFQTSIQTKMDLQALPPGKYMLAMRRAGDDWRQYPLFIGPAN